MIFFFMRIIFYLHFFVILQSINNILIETMKVVQSYLSAIVKADFSIIDMRILFFIVRRCRILTDKRKLTDFMLRSLDTSSINLYFHIPFRQLMGKSHNYAALYKSFLRLQSNNSLQYYNAHKKIWCSSSWINNVVVHYGEGFVEFTSPRWLIDYLMDFEHYGFRMYDFELAMSLSNANAARLYILTGSLTKPFSYSFDALKSMLGLESSYKTFSSFERRVLRPVMAELEKKGCNGFRYQVKRRSGIYSPVEQVVLIPVSREKSVSAPASIASSRSELPDLLWDYLTSSLSFSQIELSANRGTLLAFSRLTNWQELLGGVVDRARRKSKGKGYIIAALKSIVREKGAGGN